MAKFAFANGKSGTIVATEDIPIHNVKKGDLGGKLFAQHRRAENSEILQHYEDDVWVDPGFYLVDCKMSGNAVLRNISKSHEELGVLYNCVLQDNAQITSESFVAGIPHGTKIRLEDVHMRDDTMVSAGTRLENFKIYGDTEVHLGNFERYDGTSPGIRAVGYGCGSGENNYLFEILIDYPSLGFYAGDIIGVGEFSPGGGVIQIHENISFDVSASSREWDVIGELTDSTMNPETWQKLNSYI